MVERGRLARTSTLLLDRRPDLERTYLVVAMQAQCWTGFVCPQVGFFASRHTALNSLRSSPVPRRMLSRPAQRRSWRASATGPVRLAPSDFAFLWEECKRCFYLKAHRKLYRPRAPFPSVFNAIDLAMKRHFRGLRTTDVLPDMKPGVFLCEDDDAWIECKPIRPPGHSREVFIRGMLDCLIQFDDGSYGVIDFKTSSSAAKSSQLYSRQLHAYARGIEDPASGSELVQGRVSDLGLIIYEPSDFSSLLNSGAAMTGGLKYIHMPRDDEGFVSFLGDIMDVVAEKEPPAPPKPVKNAWPFPTTSCSYCQFLVDAKSKSLLL